METIKEPITLINQVLELVGKPFRMADQDSGNLTTFRFRNSANVVWIEEKLKYGEDKWTFHCSLVVMDSYLAAHQSFLSEFHERQFTLNDLVWL